MWPILDTTLPRPSRADSSSFFVDLPASDTCDERPVPPELRRSLRGHALFGREVRVPAGYAGVIMEEAAPGADADAKHLARGKYVDGMPFRMGRREG